MLRAGLISPGSQPRVESKRTPAVERGVPTANVTIVSETRTSGPVWVERDVTGPVYTAPKRPFVVIVGGPQLDNARKAKDALSLEFQCHVTRPLTDFKRQFPRAVLIIATADAPALGDALQLGLPVLILANKDEAAGAAERIDGRDRSDIELLPLNPTTLLQAVRNLLPVSVEDEATRVGAEGAATAAVSVTRPSAPAMAGPADGADRAATPPTLPFVVILGGARLDVARTAKDALGAGYQCQVTRPLTEFWQRYPRAELVVVTADAPVLGDALELGLPVLVLATAEEALQVSPLLEGRERVAVVTVPLDATEVAAAAATLVPPGVHANTSASAGPKSAGTRDTRARVLILSSDPLLGKRACAALEKHSLPAQSSDRRDISRGGPWDAVVMVGDIDRVATSKALARGLPLVLLPWPDQYGLALALAMNPQVVVVPIPDIEMQLREGVEQLVGAWVPRAPFDEMQRAAAISPGSSPFIESKKATPTGEGLPLATVTVLSEARGSVAAEVGYAGRVRRERARVLLLSNDFLLGQRAGSALESQCTVDQTSDRKVLLRPLRYELVVMLGEFEGAERVLRQNLPLVLLPWSNGYNAANALAVHPRVAVVPLQDIERLLLAQVEAWVGVWVPDAT